MTPSPLPIKKREEILAKAFKIAKENGWKTDLPIDRFRLIYANPALSVGFVGGEAVDFIGLVCLQLDSILYDKDFAKALWGEEKTELWNDYDRPVKGTGWKHRLQEMVISPDPLQYLSDHLTDLTKG